MKIIYVVTKDNTVYETTYIAFEGSKILFSYKEGNKIKDMSIHLMFIDSIRATM